MWLGYNQPAPKLFMTPSMNSDRNNVEDDGKGHFMASFGNIGWFTNLDISKRHEDLILFKRYREDPSFYPKYDNYDAINVDKVKYIPEDYDGVMGVPITFLCDYNPEQFEIVSFRKGEDGKDLVFTREREREFNRTFVSLYDVDSKDDKERRRKDKWGAYLRENNDTTQAIEPIDYFFPRRINFSGNDRTHLYGKDGKYTYGRIFIRNLYPLMPESFN